MSGATAIAYADQFTGQYRDQAALITAMLGTIKIQARLNFGWTGFFLIDVDWQEPRPDWLIQAPTASIVLGPGHSDVSVDDCRARLREKLWAAKQAAAALKAQQEETGRLI